MRYKSRSEDEWFARHERDLIRDLKRERERREKHLAELMRREEARRRKELHWMKCPKCGSALTETPVDRKVLLDRCSLCGGLYFDRGELEDILLESREQRRRFRIGVLHLILPSWRSRKADREKILADFHADQELRNKNEAEWTAGKEGKKAKEEHWMKCPKCGSDMREVEMPHGLMVDDCTVCHGIFLDFGELSLMESLSENERSAIRTRLLMLSLSDRDEESEE
jgi:hypothetical protein